MHSRELMAYPLLTLRRMNARYTREITVTLVAICAACTLRAAARSMTTAVLRIVVTASVNCRA
jgi:hypothetical protein